MATGFGEQPSRGHFLLQSSINESGTLPPDVSASSVFPAGFKGHGGEGQESRPDQDCPQSLMCL